MTLKQFFILITISPNLNSRRDHVLELNFPNEVQAKKILEVALCTFLFCSVILPICTLKPISSENKKYFSKVVYTGDEIIGFS